MKVANLNIIYEVSTPMRCVAPMDVDECIMPSLIEKIRKMPL